LIFCAKEAFYKCQYPLVGDAVNFHDVRVHAAAWGALEGGFEIHAIRRIVMAERTAFPLPGRYRYHEQFVTAGVGLTALAGSLQ
jgi:4'-phosphopantetheinyl transferase EntD